MTERNNQAANLKNYINAFEPIKEGRRNHALHNAGLLLRKNFGLTGVALVSALAEVNQTKCKPSLEDSEVISTARSVDKSDIPAGDKPTASKGQRGKKSLKSKRHIVYTVSTSADAVSVTDLLQKKVSIYENCLTNTPRGAFPIIEVLERFKTGGQLKDQIETIRSEPDKEKRNKLKTQLPAIVFASEPQAERKATACKSNGMIGVDFDGIVDIESAKSTIAAVPYVFAIGTSVSGTGLFALVAYEGTPDLKKLLGAMQADFPHALDKSCSDISRLRFVTLDENLIIKDKVYPAVLTEQTELADNPDDTEGTDKLAWEPLPVDVFPTSLKNYIDESAKSLNVDPSYIGAFILPVVASAIGSSIWIQLKPGWKEPSIIWTALVASSGSGKSPGLDAAIEPLRTAQNEADKNYREIESKYEEQLTIYNAKFGKWKGGLAKNSDSKPPEKPIPPIAEAYIADDTTSEALIEILSQNPFGVCLPKDELSGWLGGFDAYSGGKGAKDLPFWLAMHGCRSYRVNRKSGTKKIMIATTPAVSICGGIQPGILRKILTENKHFFDAGLAARILFAMPPDQSQRWSDDVVSEETRDRYREVINRIHRWQSNEEDKPLKPEEPDIIKLSETAQEVFIDFCNENADEREQMESDTQKAFFPKLTGYAARIALVFHIVKWIDEDTVDYDFIDGETMESAIQLTQWFKREALRINENMRGETAQVDFEASAILGAIRRKDELTARELVQSTRLFRGKGGVEQAMQKMEALVSKGQLVADERKADNGTMTKYYSLPDTVYAIPETTENGVDKNGVDGVDASSCENLTVNSEFIENRVDDVDSTCDPESAE